MYIKLFIPYIFEYGPVSDDIVLVLIIADDSLGVFDHVIVDVEMIANEVNCKGYADAQRYPSLY